MTLNPFANLMRRRPDGARPAAPTDAPIAIGKSADFAEFETHTADPVAMARAISAAGELARSGGHAPEKPSGLVAEIILAGKRRRNEED